VLRLTEPRAFGSGFAGLRILRFDLHGSFVNVRKADASNESLSQATRSQLCRRSLSKHFVEVPLKMAYFDKVLRNAALGQI
jgi:hypothetical protein